jgi:hypothetical protein
MDVVEFFFVEPVVLHVVDFEAAVGWDTILCKKELIGWKDGQTR